MRGSCLKTLAAKLNYSTAKAREDYLPGPFCAFDTRKIGKMPNKNVQMHENGHTARRVLHYFPGSAKM